MSDIDTQHQWIVDYKVDPIKLGKMCEQFPGLKNSWNEFKLVYELCKDRNETNGQTA